MSIVSIHAPLRGATGDGSLFLFCSASFNPRAPAGRDVSSSKAIQGYWVSIHAPLRGATSY